jgi:hypothetical protein
MRFVLKQESARAKAKSIVASLHTVSDEISPSNRNVSSNTNQSKQLSRRAQRRRSSSAPPARFELILGPEVTSLGSLLDLAFQDAQSVHSFHRHGCKQGPTSHTETPLSEPRAAYTDKMRQPPCNAVLLEAGQIQPIASHPRHFRSANNLNAVVIYQFAHVVRRCQNFAHDHMIHIDL